MFRLRQPCPETVQSFLERQNCCEFTYPQVGATALTPPAGCVVDHTRVPLGSGERIFHVAQTALENWQQFDLSWLTVLPQDSPVCEGQTVAICAHAFGVWWLNACRIVYLIRAKPERKAYGFAYGTLPDHVGSGEERFLVEMDAEGTVWYDVLAFSKPQHPLAKIAYPLMRQFQRRFGPQSAARMKQIVSHAQ